MNRISSTSAVSMKMSKVDKYGYNAQGVMVESVTVDDTYYADSGDSPGEVVYYANVSVSIELTRVAGAQTMNPSWTFHGCEIGTGKRRESTACDVTGNGSDLNSVLSWYRPEIESSEWYWDGADRISIGGFSEECIGAMEKR